MSAIENWLRPLIGRAYKYFLARKIDLQNALKKPLVPCTFWKTRLRAQRRLHDVTETNLE